MDECKPLALGQQVSGPLSPPAAGGAGSGGGSSRLVTVEDVVAVAGAGSSCGQLKPYQMARPGV